MNLAMLVVAFLAALNPFRGRLGMPDAASGRVRSVPVSLGLLIGGAVLVSLALVSGPLLSGLRVTPETFTIAAGLVAVLAGAWALGYPEPAREPEPVGWLSAVWPVAVPRVIAAETIVMAIAVGSREGVAAVAVGAAVALGCLAALGAFARGPITDRVMSWLSRTTAALLILVGVYLMIEGIRDV